MARRTPLLLFLFLPVLALGCEEPPPDGEAITPVISALPASVFIGAQVPLDASETEGSFNLTWRVEEPEGCDRSAPLSPTDVATTFEALCVGVHTVRLEVSPVGGDELETAEAEFEVLLPEGFLDISVSNIDEALLGAEARLTFDFDASLIPESLIDGDLFELDVTLGDNATAAPATRADPDDPQSILVTMEEAHASYEIAVQLAIAGGELRSETPAVVTLTTLNSAPEVATVVVTPFGLGESTTITGDVSDLDGDTVTCALSFAADNTSTEFALPGPDTSGACTFTLTPPAELAAWRLEMAATDEFGGADDDANPFILTPNNAPPVLEPLAVGDRVELAYGCDGAACGSDAVVIDVVATDDIDDAADLVYEIVDVTAPAGPGTVVVVPDPVVVGRFTVHVERGDVGALAGDYQLEARVTEATSAAGLEPSTSLEELTLAVLNTPPQVANITAPGVDHAFSNGSYTASVQASFDVTDAEDNAAGSVRLVGCPSGAAVDADGCGEISFDATEKDGDDVVFAISSPSIDALVGNFDFVAIATDADGGSRQQPFTVTVGNRAPVLQAGGTVQQQFIGGGQHQATLVTFVDPDGDPLSEVSANVTCPTSPCSGSVSAIIDGAVLITSTPTDFLGAYSVDGEVTDGLESASGAASFTVANTAPTLNLDAGASTASRNHITAAGLVTIDPSETGFPFVGDTSDSNGDPLTLVFSDTAVPTGVSDGFAPGPLSFTYDIDFTYAEFVVRLQNNAGRTDVNFRVQDPFGDLSDPVLPASTLLNRRPNPALATANMTFDDAPGTDALRIHGRRANGIPFVPRPITHDAGGAPPGRVGVFTDAGGISRDFIPFTMTVNIEDPDGDPIESREIYSCNALDNSLLLPAAIFRPHETVRAFDFELSKRSCGGGNTMAVLRLPLDGTLSCGVGVTVRDGDINNPVSVTASGDTINARMDDNLADSCLQF